MTHEFNRIYKDEIDYSSCESDSNGLGAYVNFTFINSGFDFSSLNNSNGFIFFNLKINDWNTINRLRVYLSNSVYTSGSINKDYTESDFLDSFHVNSGEWTGFHIPFKDLVYVNTFDVSSINLLQIKLYGSTSENLLTGKLKDVWIEFGDSIEEKYLRYSLISSGGGNGIELSPNQDFEFENVKIQKDHRLWNGDNYFYRFGEYRKIKFTQNYLPTSAANSVNAIWEDNLPSTFIFCNSYHANILDVKLTGKNKPFRKFKPPYIDLKEGKVEMESFD